MPQLQARHPNQRWQDEQYRKILVVRAADRLKTSVESFLVGALIAARKMTETTESLAQLSVEAGAIEKAIWNSCRLRDPIPWECPEWLIHYCKGLFDKIVCPACAKEFRMGAKGTFSRRAGGEQVYYCSLTCFESVNGEVMRCKLLLLNGPKPPVDEEEVDVAQLDKLTGKANEEIATARQAAITEHKSVVYRELNALVQEARDLRSTAQRDGTTATERLEAANKILDAAQNLQAEMLAAKSGFEEAVAKARESLTTLLKQRIDTEFAAASAAFVQTATDAATKLAEIEARIAGKAADTEERWLALLEERGKDVRLIEALTQVLTEFRQPPTAPIQAATAIQPVPEPEPTKPGADAKKPPLSRALQIAKKYGDRSKAGGWLKT